MADIKKTIKISGMSCAHCSARVEKALNSLKGVKATVDLEAQTATLTMKKELHYAAIADAINALGFKCEGEI